IGPISWGMDGSPLPENVRHVLHGNTSCILSQPGANESRSSKVVAGSVGPAPCRPRLPLTKRNESRHLAVDGMLERIGPPKSHANDRSDRAEFLGRFSGAFSWSPGPTRRFYGEIPHSVVAREKPSMKTRAGITALSISMLLAIATHAWSESRPLSFGVIIWRSPTLTAQFWNPIIRYVSERSGVPLHLKVAATGPEHTAMVRRGELDFLYSNHNFIKDNEKTGYRVFGRPQGEAQSGEIVVLKDSTI